MGNFTLVTPNFAALDATSSGGSITALTYTINSDAVSAIQGSSMVFTGTATVSTPSNKQWASTEVNATTDKVTTATAHGLTTGLAITVTQQGTLPTGLATSTPYYAVVFSATTFGFASSLANAKSSTLIDLQDQGSGNNTVVPTAIVGCSMKLQGSFDGTNFYTIQNPATTQQISATASIGPFEIDYVRYPFYRVAFVITSGQVTLSPLQIGLQGA